MPPLRIALIAPIARPVRVDTAHSIEQLIALLAAGLVERGHDVTLFATGDSRTPARLSSTYARGYVDDVELWDYRFHEAMNASQAFARAADFDVIHSHAYQAALPFVGLVRTPVIHTYHVDVDADVLRSFQRVPDTTVVAVSAAQRQTMTPLGYMPVVHHGIDTETFAFGPGGGDPFLLFLGRVMHRKGFLQAIDVARRAGLPLRIAGPVQGDVWPDLEPHLDGVQTTFLGPVSTAERNVLLAQAAALLYPLLDPEPFGLVLIEAMAAGTPVVATARGAVPEIVEPGITGFYADEPEQLVELVPAALALDRRAVRAAATRRWGFRRMASEYEDVYRRAVARDRVAAA